MGSRRENVGGVEDAGRAPHLSISIAPLWNRVRKAIIARSTRRCGSQQCITDSSNLLLPRKIGGISFVYLQGSNAWRRVRLHAIDFLPRYFPQVTPCVGRHKTGNDRRAVAIEPEIPPLHSQAVTVSGHVKFKKKSERCQAIINLSCSAPPGVIYCRPLCMLAGY